MTASLLTLDGDRNLARALAKRLADDVAKEETRIGRAHTSAAKDVAAAYTKLLRDDVKASGLRNADKLSNTWRARVFPGSGQGSLSPAIWLYNRSPAIIDAFSLGLPIRAGNGRFLAIPVGRAVAIVRAQAQASNRTRDSFGRFQSEGKRIDQVALALGVRLHFKPAANGKPAELISATGEVLFLLLKSVQPGRRLQGRALLTELSQRVQADFAAALARYV